VVLIISFTVKAEEAMVLLPSDVTGMVGNCSFMRTTDSMLDNVVYCGTTIAIGVVDDDGELLFRLDVEDGPRTVSAAKIMGLVGMGGGRTAVVVMAASIELKTA
jgi:adenosine/AMP kinase